MAELSLYLLSRPDDDYGKTYQVLVAASGEQSARIVAGRWEKDTGGSSAFDWVDDTVTQVDLIGYATADTESGVMMTKESAG